VSVRNSIPFTTPTWRPRAGDWVVVKSAEEIFATLDERGRLDVLPFMPEMLKFCGRRMRVAKVAHKTCDTKCKTGGRWVADCVHLEDSRCDGAAHDGCQAQCNLFWKTAWLRRADAPAHKVERPVPARCNAALLTEATREPGSDGRRFSCQATQITEASTLLPWWDVRQFARDISSGNASVGTVLRVLTLSWFAAWRSYAYPYRLSRWAYAKAHRFLMPGREVPYPPDDIDYPEKGPEGVLDLRVGERVRVKSHREIRATLSRTTGRNRGLWFDIEMVPYCGQVFRVAEDHQRGDRRDDADEGALHHPRWRGLPRRIFGLPAAVPARHPLLLARDLAGAGGAACGARARTRRRQQQAAVLKHSPYRAQ
jgi:hypothetical protein